MTRELLELPGRSREAGALARADAVLRIGLAAGWLAAGPTNPVLVLCAGLVLADAWPRAVTAAGAAAALASGLPLPAGLALLAAAAARFALVLGPSADVLREVRALRRERAGALARTELRRAEGDLAAAGDAFEEAGRARSRLAALGVEDRLEPALARLAGRLAGRIRSG